MKRTTGYLIKRGKVYYAAWTLNGKKHMQSTGKRDKESAEIELRRIMAPFLLGNEAETLMAIKGRIESVKGKLTEEAELRNPPLTLSHAWRAYVEATNRPDSGPGTMRMYKGQWHGFVSWMQNNRSDVSKLRDITSGMADAYASYLLNERKLTPNSFNKHIRLLSLVFRVLGKKAKVNENPWNEINRKVVSIQSRRELTIEELKTVCSAAKGEMRLLFALGLYSGLRLGDCATMTWSELDLVRNIIMRIPNKTARRSGKAVRVPIHPVLKAILEEIPTKSRKAFVCPDFARLYRKDNQALSRLIQRHFDACGIRTTRLGTGIEIVRASDGSTKKVNTGKRAVVEVGFHSLRHSFVSLCRESNAALSVVESIVGHSNPALTRHYTHVSESAARDTVAKLPTIEGLVPSMPSPLNPMPADEIHRKLRTLTDKLNSRTWKVVKAELDSLL